MATSDSWQCLQAMPTTPAPLYSLSSSLFLVAIHTKLGNEREREFLFFNEALLVIYWAFAILAAWLILGVLLIAAFMIRYANFQQQPLRPQPQAPQNELSGQQVDVPTFETRVQLPDVRMQLAHLNREFDDSDYDALRALDEDIFPNLFAISEEEINAIPIYKYKVQSHTRSQKVEDFTKIEGSKLEENGLTCSICLEQVNEEELIRRLRCYHEFHASCISTWLRQRGTCPICKRWAV